MLKHSSLFLLTIFLNINLSFAQNSDTIVTDTFKYYSSEENCNFYFENNWLPDSYIQNAYCACIKLPNTSEANGIRYLLKKQLNTVNDSIKTLALNQKANLKSDKTTKWKYNKFVKKTLTPLIYQHHVLAYQYCGCIGKPAQYQAWKQITTTKINNCNLIWLSICCFGSCSNRIGKW